MFAQSRKKYLHFTKGIFLNLFLFGLIGWISFLVSATTLSCGYIDSAIQQLARRVDNKLGIITSYFIHRDYHHLYSNLTAYLFLITAICILHTCKVEEGYSFQQLMNWKRWNFLTIGLMIAIGTTDYVLNPMYRKGANSVGLSDLICALATICLAHLHLSLYQLAYGKFSKNEKRIPTAYRICFSYFSVALMTIISTGLSESFQPRITNYTPNVFAHGVGFFYGLLISVI